MPWANDLGGLPDEGRLISMARRRALAAVSAALIVCVATFGVLNARAVSVVRIFVDGQEVVPDVPAQIIEGRTMVPIRFVAEAMNAEVAWNPDLYSVIISTDRSKEEKAYMDWLERFGKVIEENSKLSKQLPTRPGDPQRIALLRQESANLQQVLELARTVRPPKDAVADFHQFLEGILRVKLGIDLSIRADEEWLRGNYNDAWALARAATESIFHQGP